MSKGTAFSRTVSYFREASHDEARAAYMLVQEIMQHRSTVSSKPVSAAPKVKRHRRTKAQMAEAMAHARAAKAARASSGAVAASGGALAELYEDGKGAGAA
jgi:hypothetical protein